MCDCDRCQRGVSAAQANLQQVLVAMRKLLRLPRLEYVSIQNQADFLIEVPVEMSDVPKVCCPPYLKCSTQGVSSTTVKPKQRFWQQWGISSHLHTTSRCYV